MNASWMKPGAGSGLAVVLACALTLAAVGNALFFVSKAANPMVSSDGWHFLDSIVRPYATGQFEVADLFSKRDAMDHAQPLRRGILLMHYEFFDLDYRIEAFIGVLAAFANLLLMAWVGHRARDRLAPDLAGALVFSALAVVYLSMNATTVFTWPLVTLNYTSHTFVILAAIAAWFALVKPGWKTLLLMSAAVFTMCIVADDTGLLAGIAIALACVLHAIRVKSDRGPALRTALASVVALTVYQVGYFQLIDVPGAGNGQGTTGLLLQLAANWRDAWSWIEAPLVASLVHRTHLRAWFGEHATFVITLLAISLLLAHAWFWWKAFLGRQSVASHLAIVLMLLFYGLLAGILIARVSAHGAEYLWQPRYALIYQWNLIALLMMALAQLGDAARFAAKAGVRIHSPAILAGMLVILQLPLAASAWQSVPHIRNYHARQAMQIGRLAASPADVPAKCIPQLTVCKFPLQARQRLFGFLSGQELNVFSAGFQRRNRLGPDGPIAPAPARPEQQP